MQNILNITENIIIPLVAVVLTVWGTALIEKKMLKKTKLIELRCQYLSKSLEELNSIEIKLFECVRLMDSCLMKLDSKDRMKAANQIIKEISEVNIHILSFTTNQETLNNSIGIELDLRGLHDKLGKITTELHDMFLNYLRKGDNSEFMDEANALVIQAKDDISKYVKYISDEISKFLKG